MKCDMCENELESWWTLKMQHPRLCQFCGEELEDARRNGDAHCEPADYCSDPHCEVCDNEYCQESDCEICEKKGMKWDGDCWCGIGSHPYSDHKVLPKEESK